MDLDAFDNEETHKDIFISAYNDQAIARVKPNRTATVRTRAWPVHDQRSVLWIATIMHLWPWRRGEYRGWSVAASDALGLKTSTVRRWVQRNCRAVGSPTAGRVSALLRARAEVALALAEQWDAYRAEALEREARTARTGGFRSQRLAEKDGWRSKRAPVVSKRKRSKKPAPAP